MKYAYLFFTLFLLLAFNACNANKIVESDHFIASDPDIVKSSSEMDQALSPMPQADKMVPPAPPSMAFNMEKFEAHPIPPFKPDPDNLAEQLIYNALELFTFNTEYKTTIIVPVLTDIISDSTQMRIFVWVYMGNFSIENGHLAEGDFRIAPYEIYAVKDTNGNYRSFAGALLPSQKETGKEDIPNLPVTDSEEKLKEQIQSAADPDTAKKAFEFLGYNTAAPDLFLKKIEAFDSEKKESMIFLEVINYIEDNHLDVSSFTVLNEEYDN